MNVAKSVERRGQERWYRMQSTGGNYMNCRDVCNFFVGKFGLSIKFVCLFCNFSNWLDIHFGRCTGNKGISNHLFLH